MKTNKKIINKVSEELGISKEKVRLAYSLYWKFIKDKIEDFDFDNISESDLDNMKTSFNIHLIGKLYTNKERIKHINYLNSKLHERLIKKTRH